jgi:hypothetical protein
MKGVFSMKEKDNLVNRRKNEMQPRGFILSESFVRGLLQHENEVDTDRNEDQNRERLLDESFASFMDEKQEK